MASRTFICRTDQWRSMCILLKYHRHLSDHVKEILLGESCPSSPIVYHLIHTWWFHSLSDSAAFWDSLFLLNRVRKVNQISVDNNDAFTIWPQALETHGFHRRLLGVEKVSHCTCLSFLLAVHRGHIHDVWHIQGIYIILYMDHHIST